MRDIARGELYLADEVFMTGTAAELTPLREIDDRPVGDGTPGPITRDVQREFEDALHGRSERYARLARRRGDPGARDVSGVLVYDCTLRDGMQGEGMSLSAEEKLRVAHVLDDLGVPMIEAGFPASNPKEAELFELLAARDVLHRRDRRLRDDAPARRPGRRRTRRCGCWPAASRPSARSSARPGACTSRRSCGSAATRTCA